MTGVLVRPGVGNGVACRSVAGILVGGSGVGQGVAGRVGVDGTVGGSTAPERGLQPLMSKQHSNAAGKNAAIGKIQYRLLEFAIDLCALCTSAIRIR